MKKQIWYHKKKYEKIIIIFKNQKLIFRKDYKIFGKNRINKYKTFITIAATTS